MAMATATSVTCSTDNRSSQYYQYLENSDGSHHFVHASSERLTSWFPELPLCTLRSFSALALRRTTLQSVTLALRPRLSKLPWAATHPQLRNLVNELRGVRKICFWVSNCIGMILAWRNTCPDVSCLVRNRIMRQADRESAHFCDVRRACWPDVLFMHPDCYCTRDPFIPCSKSIHFALLVVALNATKGTGSSKITETWHSQIDYRRSMRHGQYGSN